MGRNSKKNKGRKPAADQGLKGAASLASPSANVATAPSRPARTAKHKVRKFPTPATSTQANDSRTVRGLKETQPVPNSVKQETLPSNPSTTHTSESLRTSTVISTESAVTVSSLNETENALHQPITTNLSDSYESSSVSSSETEMGVQDDVGDIPNTVNVAEMLKIEQKGTTQQTQKVSELQQGDEEPNGLVAEEHKDTLLLVMEGKEVPQRADSIEHISGIVAITDVPGPFTTLSPCLHDKLEAEVTELLIGNASTAQADEANISFGEGAKQKTNSPLQVSHPDKHDEVQEVLSSYFKTETSKQTIGDDRSSGRKEDSELLKAKADVSEQSTSGSETTLIDESVTSCTSPDNLKQKNDEEQELEIVNKESFEKGLEKDQDQTPAEKNNDPENFAEEIESTGDTSSHKILPSAAAYNVVQEPLERNDLQKGTNEETRQVNLCCIDKAPPCSIQESASSNVDKQVERNAQEPLGDILQQQEREMSELGISDVMIQKNVVQALEQTDSNLSLESEQGQAPIVKEQQLHADIEQEYEPEELNRTTSGTVENERRIVYQEFQSLTVEKESTTSIHGTMPVSPADIITETQQDMQESHAENLSTSVNAASEAHETKVENYLVSQILERQEDVDVKLEAESVVPKEAATSEKHNLLNAEQHILVEPEINATAIDTTNECQEKHDQIYIGSTYEEHTTNSLENKVEKVEVAETEVEDLELKEKKKSQDEQPDQLDRGTVFEGHATNSAGSEMESLELQVNSTLVDQEECQEEKPDQAHSGSICEEHKTTDNLENDIEKPDVGEPQVVSVTLDKDWEEKPGQVYNDSVHTRSLENAIEKLEGGKSEEAIVFEEKKEFEANPSQLNDIRKCAVKKPEVEERELESASLEEKECREEMPDQVGSVCKEETNSVGNQLENELEVDNVASHKEKESQEDKLDQLDRRPACEGHATNSVENKLQVGEPEVKDISLNKEDYEQENTDHAHGVSVCQEYKIKDSPENAMEKLDVGEPTVGSVMLHEDQQCKEDEPDQQLDRGIEGRVNSVESEMESLEVGQPEVKGITLDKHECLQEKTDHADCGSVCQEDKTTESLEYVMDKFDDGEPLVGGDEDHECQEEKLDQQLDGSTVCEEHATNSIEREMEKLAVGESEAELITLNKEEAQEEKTDQAHSGSLCEEHKTKETLENVERLDSHVENIALDRDQAYQEEKPDQVDSDTACQEHNKSSENEIEELELGIPTVIEEEKESQEKHSTRSVEEEMEQSKPEVESVTLEEKQDSTEEIPGQVDSGCGSVDEEHDTRSAENQREKPEEGEPEVEGVALHKEKESREDELHQLERSIVCEGHAKLSVQSEMEEVEAEKPKVTLDKEECQEEKHHEADVGSSCEEHQQTHFLEDAMKKPDVGEPHVGVMLDKHQELQRETSDQVDCDSICQEHPTSSMENEIEKLEVGESEKAITIEEKECQEEHAATNFMGNEMEQPKPKVQSVTPEENKENPDEMPDPTDSGHAFKEHEMHSVKIELEKPEVEEPEVEGVALQKEREIREDELDHLPICERYAETCVDSEMEKIEGGKPKVTLDKDECKEEKHYQADDGSLCEEHQQTEMEKPLMGEPQVEGVELDKDQESLEDKTDRVSGDSGSQEHPTSYSTENEIEKHEVRELEKAIALEEEKECPQEHTTKSEENEMEQPKPEVEIATPHSPKEMQDHIDSGYVGEEHEMHSVENELEKPEVREAEIESVTLYKKKDSQEDEPDQLERGTVCKEDAKDSIKIETEKLEVGKPDLNSTALHKEECEEEKHRQADDGSVYEDHQVTDFLENALKGMPNVGEPQVGALDKEEYEEEKHHQADDNFVYKEHRERDFLENALEKTNVGEPQVEGIMLDKDQELQEDIANQVDSDSASQEDTTSSMKNEIEKLEVGGSEEAITIKEEKDCQEEHTTKSADNDLEQPKPEAETAALEEKKESPEEMPDQIDHGCGCAEYEMEYALEKIEVGEAEVESNAVHGKKECHEQEFNQLERGLACEGDATNFIESEKKMLEVGKPEVASTTLKEECKEGKHDQADGGSVCEKHQVTDFLEHAMEKPDVGEPQVKGVTLNKDQELPEEKSDQVDSETVCQEHATNSELEKLEVRESQIAIAVEENQEKHTINRVENGMQQPKPKVESTTLEEKKESPEQMPDQVDGSYVREEHEMPSVANEFENPEMGEPEVESVALQKKKESQEDQLEQLERGAVCEEHIENCVENEVNNTALDKEECEEAKNDQADSGSACEKDQVTDFLEHAMETPDVEVPQVEGATLYNDQELPEEKLDLVDNNSACKDNTTRAFESKIEKLEVGESEAAIGLYQEKEYQEHPCQLNVCDEHSMSSAENTKEKPAVKELDHQKNESKEGQADEVSGSSPNEQLITDSGEKDLERLEAGEAQVGLALEEMEDCQPNHANSVCEEQAQKSVLSELKQVELEEPEAGAVALDKEECQEEEPGQVHSSSICEEKTTNLMKNLEKPEMEEPKVDDVKLEKVKLGQEENPANVENSYQNTTSFLQGKTDKLELDEPEGSDAALETVDCEKEPYQLHIEPVTEEHDINSPDNEMEKLEGREPEGSVKLDGENEDQEEKHADIKKFSQGQEQTTSCLEIKLEKLKAEDPEVTLEKVKDHQDDKPCQLDSGSACDEPEVGEQEVESAALQKKKECQEENTDQVEREPEAGGVMLDEIKGCYEDKPNQIGSHSECGQHPATEHEMEKLEVGEPQEECPEKEECQEEDSDRLSSAFVCEEQATNIAETEKEKLEMGDPEVDNFLLNNEELQTEKPDRVRDSSEGEQYITRSLESIEKLEVENSELDEKKPDSVYEEQTTDFVENETKKSEVGAPGVEVIKLEKNECKIEKPDQIMGSSVSEEHATDLEDDDMDKLQVSQPELAGIVALDERKECVVRESQQVDDNRCLSEVQMVESVENEKEKPEMGLPEVEDLLNEMERQSEEPDQSTSHSASEEYATNSKEDDMNKLEVDQPEIEKPDQLADSRFVSEEHTADSVENETEKPEVILSEVLHNKEDQSEKPDQARSNSICGEHAADSKDNDMDKLESNQPEIGMPHQVTSSRSVGAAHIADSVENGTEKPEMELPEVEDNVPDEKECHSDRPDPDEHSSVCEEHVTDSREDHTDDLEVNQPKVEKPDEIIASTTSVSEAHTLDSLKKETEKSEVDVLEEEDNVLERDGEKPDQDESSSVYEEHATDSKKDGIDKPEVNQPEVGEPDQVMAVGTSVNEIDTLDSLRNGTEKLEEGVGNVLEQKECHGEKPDQNESSSVLDEHATDFKKDDMEKPEEGMAKEEDNVLEQKECLPDQDENSSAFEEHATDYKEDDTDKLEVNQAKVEEPHQVIASSTSESETHTLDSLRNETEKPEEGVLEVEDNALAPTECLGEKTEQDENSSVCEEHAADSKEDCINKLEVNKPEVEKPLQVIAGSTPVSETHILDSQENKTEKNEEGVSEVEDNVLEEKVGEKPNLDESSYVREEPNLHESSYVCEEHATDSKEDDMDKLEVNLPESGQDNVLEEQECLGEKPDQDESSSVCEGHAKEDVDKLEVNLPEPDKVITDGTSLREHTLNSVENGTEESEVGVPEVKDDGLACGTFSTPQEVTASSSNDYLKTKDEEQETQPVNFPVALSPENREDKSDLLSMTQDVQQTTIHDFSIEENVEAVPAEGKQEEEFEQASGNSENACEQLLAAIDQKTKQASENDPSSREEEWKIKVKDLPAVSKSETEEIEFRQTTEMSDAPRPQEGTREIPEQLDTAKPEEAKQEPLHHLQSWKEEQETHSTDEPVLSQETQKHVPYKVDVAIPLENIPQEANNVNLTTNGQEVEAKEIGTHADKQKSQCQGTSLPTLALAELQAQQAIQGLELSTIESSPSDVKDTLLDIKEHKDGAQEQHSPQSVLEQQESPAEDDKSYRIQKVAATQYQVDNPEPLSDKDVETRDTDQTNSNGKHNSECNITGLPMLATELGNQLNLMKQQHESQKPKNLDVEAENATDMNIPILSDEGMKPEDRQQKRIDEAFESLHTPVMTCSTPSNLLPLPL